MKADHVLCSSCNEEMYVVVGTKVCPNCRVKGTLEWADEEKPEKEVSITKISNYFDYKNVIKGIEKFKMVKI